MSPSLSVVAVLFAALAHAVTPSASTDGRPIVDDPSAETRMVVTGTLAERYALSADALTVDAACAGARCAPRIAACTIRASHGRLRWDSCPLSAVTRRLGSQLRVDVSLETVADPYTSGRVRYGARTPAQVFSRLGLQVVSQPQVPATRRLARTQPR